MPRERLLLLLDLAAAQRVTTIVAPPGYGKTVLLAQWARSHARQRVCWLTLRPDDDDPDRFARDLCASLGLPSVALADVAAELELLPPTTLVLDDFQQIADEAVLRGLGALLEDAPRSFHVVIATRVDPPLSYYQWRLSDTLVELRQEDLAFTHDEAATLLGELARRELSTPQVDALLDRTEGWAVGLQLAALSVRDRPDADAFVEQFAGDDSFVAAYLTDEVVGRLPTPTRDFLLATSVLQEMSAPLCEHVTGRSGAQAALDELDRTSLFITRLVSRRGWYRYHDLFRTLLRQVLRAEDPAREATLLGRAAEWHLARGELDVGVSYLLQAGDWEGVIAAATSHGAALLARSEAGLASSWLARVPPTARDGRVAVALVEAAGSTLGGEIARAEEQLDGLLHMDGLTPADRAVIDLLRSYTALQRGDLARTIELADRVLEVTDTLDEADLTDVFGLTGSRTDLLAGARLTRGLALVYVGDGVEARRTLELALVNAHVRWQVAALGGLALVQSWLGRLGAADQLAARAIALAGQLGIAGQPPTADAYLAAARVARLQDRLDDAASLLADASARVRSVRRPSLGASAAAELMLLAAADGRPGTVRSALNGRRAGEHPLLAAAVRARHRAAEALLLMSLGDLDGAGRILASEPPSGGVDVVGARVRLALERGDVACARQLVDRWPDDASPRSRLAGQLWLAVVEHLEGDEASAQARLASVVSAASLEGDFGLFRDAGGLVLGPARILYRTSPAPFLRAIVDSPAFSRSACVGEALIEPLTERELMVLALLPQRLSNEELAARLGVSLNTVKSHLKHIYRKFGVGGRAAAVEAAERLHIL